MQAVSYRGGQGKKAHIVPEAFFRLARGDDPHLADMSIFADRRVKRSAIGPYDTELVCSSCEDTFGPFDDYGAKLLLHDLVTKGERIVTPNRRQSIFFRYRGLDYRLLRLFALSLLWRAAASVHDDYHQVRLPPDRLERLGRMIRDGDPGTPDVYASRFGRWDYGAGEDPLLPIMMNPAYSRLAGFGYVRFYLGPAFLDIKTDVRPWPFPLPLIAIRPGCDVFMPSLKFDESREFRDCVVPAIVLNDEALNKFFGERGSAP